MEAENNELVVRVLKGIIEARKISPKKDTCIINHASESIRLTPTELSQVLHIIISLPSGIKAEEILIPDSSQSASVNPALIPFKSTNEWKITFVDEDLFNTFSKNVLLNLQNVPLPTPPPDNWKWVDKASGTYQFGDKTISFRGDKRKDVFVALMQLCLSNPEYKIATQALKNELGYNNTKRLHIEIPAINERLKEFGLQFKGSENKEGYYKLIPFVQAP